MITVLLSSEFPKKLHLPVAQSVAQVMNSIHQAPVVQTLDSAIHQAPVVQKLHSAIHQAEVVQKLDNAIHRINHYPADKYIWETDCVIHWTEIYPSDNAIHLSNNWGQTNSN